MKTTLPLCIIFFCCGLLYHAAAFAGDELHLCGIVQEVDQAKGTAKINVLSASCPGVQIFKLANAQTGTILNVGEKKCFLIDSVYCADTFQHTIVKVDGE